MLVLALLPLGFYLAFLTCLHFRQNPTLLNGSSDFSLLAWGLFGLITLGPGRLMIPIYVFSAWEEYTWFFWICFYYVITHSLAFLFAGRMIVYNSKREIVLPAFFSLARQIDPKTEWSGNVLSMHGLGLQWSVTNGQYGNYLLFIPTNPRQKHPQKEDVQKQFEHLCRTLKTPKQRTRWFWGILTFALFGLIFMQAIHDVPMLLQLLTKG